ncbi:MAG: ABC transporter substrate-binding protein [Alphaproteobacteria bacterium]|nr:ABC transporter substrate-binding protein [Alphaproteobacteria bacterium]
MALLRRAKCGQFALFALACWIIGSAALAVRTAEAQDPAAQIAEGARTFMEQLSVRAVEQLTGSDISEETREARFRDLFNEVFDVRTMARFVLGRYWKRSDQALRERFVAAFEDFVVAAYLDRFRAFTGEKLEVFTSTPNKRGNGAIVDSQILRPNGEPVRVHWDVYLSNGGVYRIVDIKAEGVSLAQTHRSEFSAIINKDGGGVEYLIAALQKKSAKLMTN